MKNLTKTTAILIIALIFNFSVKAQNAAKTTDGNYTAIKYNFNDTTKLNNTGKLYSDNNGNTYPVYISTTGKLFIIRTSKAGNSYRLYLKLQND